jgi:hypothetical protein
MLTPNRTLYEDLRQAAWHVLSLRDSLLKAAEALPPPDREKVIQTAGKFLVFCTRLREIAMTLPTDPEVDQLEELDDPEAVRDCIECALEEYESALEDLGAFIEESDEESP